MILCQRRIHHETLREPFRGRPKSLRLLASSNLRDRFRPSWILREASQNFEGDLPFGHSDGDLPTRNLGLGLPNPRAPQPSFRRKPESSSPEQLRSESAFRGTLARTGVTTICRILRILLPGLRLSPERRNETTQRGLDPGLSPFGGRLGEPPEKHPGWAGGNERTITRTGSPQARQAAPETPPPPPPH